MPQGELIAPYITLAEYRCQHCHALPPGLKKNSEGEWPTIFEALFTRFAALREAVGHPINVTSGYRCPTHEHEISGSNISTHVFGLALDLGIGLDEQESFVHLIEMVCPEVRLGRNRKPGQIHLHVDVGYYIYPVYSSSLKEYTRWEE